MSKTVQTTRIEKKYKDKKTGEYKSITIDFAKVVDRLKVFREDYPNGKISTAYKLEEGDTVFKAYVWKDKEDFLKLISSGTTKDIALLSCDAEGTAKNSVDGEKDFEKLETIAIGRALAILGYTAGGEIASSEEMEEFLKYKDNKIEDAIEKINETKTIDELKATYLSLGMMKYPKVVTAKDLQSIKLQKASKA